MCITFWCQILMLSELDEQSSALALTNLAASVHQCLNAHRIVLISQRSSYWQYLGRFAEYLGSQSLLSANIPPRVFCAMLELVQPVLQSLGTDHPTYSVQTASVMLGKARQIAQQSDPVQLEALRDFSSRMFRTQLNLSLTAHARQHPTVGTRQQAHDLRLGWIGIIVDPAHASSAWACLLDVLGDHAHHSDMLLAADLFAAAAVRYLRSLPPSHSDKEWIIKGLFAVHEGRNLLSLILGIVSGWPAPTEDEDKDLKTLRIVLCRLLRHCVELHPDWVGSLRSALLAEDYLAGPDVVAVIDSMRRSYSRCIECGNLAICLDTTQPAIGDGIDGQDGPSSSASQAMGLTVHADPTP
ncbi:hypothetical protein EXIGLDRAFT_778714 [Exidia glandulosa HHB12029]|uniref:Uncharacterized protein n=1 Tax=Exidia glandulosa HHB12029 TaxID=1314781 RepID=A0A165CF13_EXIGL|nr:hypothetical protein EXIGLDRAFT_778714 [Exidia glandulosa HHB12029]